MFCVNCGYPLNEGEKECSFCGKEIVRAAKERGSFEAELGKSNQENYQDEDANIDIELEDVFENQDDSNASFVKNKNFLEQDDDGLPSLKFDALEGYDNLSEKVKPGIQEVTEDGDMSKYETILAGSGAYEQDDYGMEDDQDNYNQNSYGVNHYAAEQQPESSGYSDSEYPEYDENEEYNNNYGYNPYEDSREAAQDTNNNLHGQFGSDEEKMDALQDALHKSAFEEDEIDAILNSGQSYSGDYEDDDLPQGASSFFDDDLPPQQGKTSLRKETEQFSNQNDQYYEDDLPQKSFGQFENYFDDNALPEQDKKVAGFEDIPASVDDEFLLGRNPNKVDPSAFLSKIVNKDIGAPAKESGRQMRGSFSDFEKKGEGSSKFKIILVGVAAVVVLLIIVMLISSMFGTDYKNIYIELEAKNLEKLLGNAVAENGKALGENITAIQNKSVNSTINFSNFDIDVQSRSLFDLPASDGDTDINKMLNIVWDRKLSPKDKVAYNDFKINIKNGEYLRVQFLKQANILKIMAPSIYPKVFKIDTTNMPGFYKSAGLKKDPSIPEISLNENDFMATLTLSKNIASVGADVRKWLGPTVISDKIVQTPTTYMINDSKITADKYVVEFGEQEFKAILKQLLTRAAKDEDIYKMLAGKYIVMGDIIRQLGLDDGKLSKYSKEGYFAYINDLNKLLETVKLDNMSVATIWVDKNSTVVGRNYAFTVKAANGDTAKVTLYYNAIDEDAKKYNSLQLVVEPKGPSFRPIQFKIESNTKQDAFKATSKVETETAMIKAGIANAPGYLDYSYLSDKNISAEASNNKYIVSLNTKAEAGDFKFYVSAAGKEAGSIKNNKVNGDYNVIYEIASTNQYKGKFDFKFDTIYGEGLDLPANTSLIVADTTPTIEMNSLNEKSLNEMYLDIQVKYKAYQRRIAELLGLKAATQTKLN